MRQRTLFIGAVFAFMVTATVSAQGLFESAGSGSTDSATVVKQSKSFDLSGYVKGALFGGQDNADKTIMSGSYGQASLKLTAEKSGLGRAFTELRLNAGINRGAQLVDVDLREAWVDVSPGSFDIKLGRQIVTWGRADAINPTNNITPKDATVLSSEFDDTRLGNELLQVRAKIGKSSIQGIWVPCYQPDVLPLSGAEIPPEISIADPVYPDMKFENGSYALRLEYSASKLDGSVSYFNGYATLPGFDYSLGQAGLSLIPRAYRMHTGGLDFSTAIASVGVRGEAAIKYPFDDYDKDVYVPNPYVHYVAGLDKSIGNVGILLQYSGVYVIDYSEIIQPRLAGFDLSALMLYADGRARAEIERMNRLFTGTANNISHAITGNVQWNTLYETLHLKIAGMYDFTTEDYVVNPSVSYDIADALNLTVGGRYLDGPDEKLNHMVSKLMSMVYTELKLSF